MRIYSKAERIAVGQSLHFLLYVRITRIKTQTTDKGTTIFGNMQQFHKKGVDLASKKAFCKVLFTNWGNEGSLSRRKIAHA